MLNEYYRHLKSGTDIRGIAVDGVLNEPVTLTDDVAEAVGYGFAAWLKENCKPGSGERFTVALGHDSRVSAERLAKAITEPMLRCGINIKDCGLASTPAMFMTTVNFDCDAAVEITASHHPFNRNGFKFFTKQGGLEGEDVESILEYAQNGDRPIASEVGERTETPYMNEYAKGLRDMICEGINADDYSRPLRGFHIVVDAGNGVGGFYATKVLEPLGADITGSQFLEPDGMFPNHMPNPENEEAMASISEAVVREGADFGVIFDTDVDRAACVDENGRSINRNALIALASCIALEGNEGGTIVTDSVTSAGLKDFIENELGGKHWRFKRGYRNVINEAKRLNLEECVNAPLAIETSGHAAMRDNYFLDDGAYLITQIIIKAATLRKEGRTLGSLIEKLVEPVEACEYRIGITADDFGAYGNMVIDSLTKFIESCKEYELATDSREGIRAEKKEADGWFLLRLSVHDPVLPLNIESNMEGGTKNILSDLLKFFGQFPCLETSCFNGEEE